VAAIGASVVDDLRSSLKGIKDDATAQAAPPELTKDASDAKAPGDAADFKGWLLSISQKVAEASAEGGFLGVGGVQVSDAEKATLADIAKALGTA
jgi:hypothetical protein